MPTVSRRVMPLPPVVPGRRAPLVLLPESERALFREMHKRGLLSLASIDKRLRRKRTGCSLANSVQIPGRGIGSDSRFQFFNFGFQDNDAVFHSGPPVQRPAAIAAHFYDWPEVDRTSSGRVRSWGSNTRRSKNSPVGYRTHACSCSRRHCRG